MNIQDYLKSNADPIYRDFNAKLLPTVPKNKILGVRTPIIRKFAKEIFGSETACNFTKALPHVFYEENNLHGFIIEKIKDFDECIFELERFLPYIDNWATCDCISPKVFKKAPEGLSKAADRWIKSETTYNVRFGIGIYMKYFLDKNFIPEYSAKIALIKSDEYYINMMISWYFATALAKQYDTVIPYLEGKMLPEWVHKKTIQKAIESYRISPEKKEYLKLLK